MIRKLLCFSLLLGASALATPKRAATLRLRAAVEVRGGALIPKEGFVKACAWVYGIYGIQFTLMTKKFIEDHFKGPADPLAIFMARGAGVSIMWMAWSLTKLPLETVFLRAAASRAIPRASRATRRRPLVVYNVLTGLVYPWNAAYISKLPVKYPMHYVPEALMAGFSVAGILAAM